MKVKWYEEHTEITKAVLDTVQVDDLVKCNDWKVPYRVKGVSENYFVMTRKQFGKVWYSVCEKKPWDGIRYNSMVGGMFHIGTDNSVFGWSGGYTFDDPALAQEYLQAFENGEMELSMRTSVPLTFIAIKKAVE